MGLVTLAQYMGLVTLAYNQYLGLVTLPNNQLKFWTTCSWLSGHNSGLHAPGSRAISLSCMGLVTLAEHMGLVTLALNSGAGYPGTQFWGWLPWHSILGLVTLTLNSGAGYPGTQLPMLISAM